MQAILKYQSEQLISSNNRQNVNVDSLWQQLENTFYFPMRSTKPLRACQGRQNIITAFGQYTTSKQFYSHIQLPRAQQSKNNNESSNNEYINYYSQIDALQNINFDRQKQFTITEIEFPNLIQQNTTDYLLFSQYKQMGKQNLITNQIIKGSKQAKDQYKQVVQYPSTYTLSRYYPLILNSGEVIYAKHCFGNIYGPSIHMEPDGKIWQMRENTQDGFTIRDKDEITFVKPEINKKLSFFLDGKIESTGQLRWTYNDNMFALKHPTQNSLIFDTDNHIEIIYFTDASFDIYRECLNINNNDGRDNSQDNSVDGDSEIDIIEDAVKQCNTICQKDKQLYYTKQLSVNQLQCLKNNENIIHIPVLHEQQSQNRDAHITNAKNKIKQILYPQKTFHDNYDKIECIFKPITNFCTICLNCLPADNNFYSSLNLIKAHELTKENIILTNNDQLDNIDIQNNKNKQGNNNVFEINDATSETESFQQKLIKGLKNNKYIFKYDVLLSYIRNKSSILFQSCSNVISKQFLFCLRNEKYSKGIIIQYFPRSKELNSIIDQLSEKLAYQEGDMDLVNSILTYIELQYNKKVNTFNHEGIKWKNLYEITQQYEINIDTQTTPLSVLESKNYEQLIQYFNNLLELTDDIVIHYGVFDNYFITFLRQKQTSSNHFQENLENEENQSSLLLEHNAKLDEQEKNISFPQQKTAMSHLYKTDNVFQLFTRQCNDKNYQTILQTTIISLRINMIQIICLNEYTMGKTCVMMHNDFIILLNLNNRNKIVSPFCILTNTEDLKKDKQFNETITRLQKVGTQTFQQEGIVNKQYIYELISCKQQQYVHYFSVTHDHLLYSFLFIDDWLSQQRLISTNIASYIFNINLSQTKIQLVINPSLKENMASIPMRSVEKFRLVITKLILLRIKICFQNISSSNDIFYELEKIINKDQASSLAGKLQKGKSSKSRLIQRSSVDSSTISKNGIEVPFISVAFNQLFIFLMQVYTEININDLLNTLGFQLYVNDKQCVSYEILHQLDHFISRMIYLGIQ